MQEKQRQDSLTQQRYENEASERAYQDALKQQAFNNRVTSEKLNIAKGEWALKQSNAQAKASRAAGNAAAKSRGSGKASGSAAGTNALKGSSVVPFTAARCAAVARVTRPLPMPCRKRLHHQRDRKDPAADEPVREKAEASIK